MGVGAGDAPHRLCVCVCVRIGPLAIDGVMSVDPTPLDYALQLLFRIRLDVMGSLLDAIDAGWVCLRFLAD